MDCANCNDREEWCDACRRSFSESESQLYKCPKCGQFVCDHCCGGIGTICIDCEEIQDGRMVNDIF